MSMLYPDVTNPIIINASSQLSSKKEFFLRRCCLVSLGSTSLEKGVFKTVTIDDYTPILKEGSSSEFKNVVNSFFAFAGPNRQLTILEAGGPDNEVIRNSEKLERSISVAAGTEADTLEATATPGTDVKSVMFEDEEVEIDVVISLDEVLKKKLTVEATAQGGTVTEQNTASLKKFIFTPNSGVTSGWVNIKIELNAGTTETPSLKTYNRKFNIDIKPVDKVLTYDKAVKEILKFMNSGLARQYVYALENKIWNTASLNELIPKINSVDSKCYIFLETEKNFTGLKEKAAAQLGDTKGAMVIVNNGVNFSLLGAVLGKFANPVFDISSQNPASPLNFKALNGLTYQKLPADRISALIDFPATFADNLAGNPCIMNGRNLDGKPFNYWYQWDVVSYEIETRLQMLLLNGVNNPNYAIKYDQNGIDTVKASVEAVLTNMINFRCITDYSADYNAATNEMINFGSIKAENFTSYVKNNPEDYANEVYKGISFYARIGRFIRQIVLNVSLG